MSQVAQLSEGLGTSGTPGGAEPVHPTGSGQRPLTFQGKQTARSDLGGARVHIPCPGGGHSPGCSRPGPT